MKQIAAKLAAAMYILYAPMICFALPAGANISDNAIQLKYSLNLGEEYVYSQRTLTKQSVGDMGMSGSIEAGNDITLQIKEAKNRGYKIETAFTPMKMSISGLEQAGIPDTVMLVAIPPSASESIIITEDGSVIDGQKNNSTAAVVGDGGEYNAMGNMGAAALRQAVKQTFTSILGPLPNRSIAVGEVWTRETSGTGASPGTKITAKWEYTLAGTIDTLGKHCGIIIGKTTSLTIEGSTNQMGMEIHIEGDGSAISRTIVEIANGMSVAGKIAMQLETRIAVSGQDQMVAPVSMETVNIFRRKIK